MQSLHSVFSFNAYSSHCLVIQFDRDTFGAERIVSGAAVCFSCDLIHAASIFSGGSHELSGTRWLGIRHPADGSPSERVSNTFYRIDPFAMTDALHSIANYLRGHGWRPGMDRNGQHRVIFDYNHSTVYANTVLAVAEKLKERGLTKP